MSEREGWEHLTPSGFGLLGKGEARRMLNAQAIELVTLRADNASLALANRTLEGERDEWRKAGERLSDLASKYRLILKPKPTPEALDAARPTDEGEDYEEPNPALIRANRLRDIADERDWPTETTGCSQCGGTPFNHEDGCGQEDAARPTDPVTDGDKS